MMPSSIATSLVPPAAIDTSELYDDLTHQQSVLDPSVLDPFVRTARWQHTNSPSRRAKSHSPSRRSPKIKHTNGRLDDVPITVFHYVDIKQQQRLLWLQPTRMVPSRSHRMHESGVSESEIPKRAVVARATTSDSQRVGQSKQKQRESDATSLSSTRRLKACYRDDAFRERSAANTRRMIVIARQQSDGGASKTTSNEADGVSSSSSSNQQTLALKALKYRKLLARAKAIDEARLADPTFDVLEGLGVKWCRV